MTEIVRPNPVLWLKYAFGSGLPAKYNDWVLHDTTCPTWVFRQFGRAVTQLSLPILAVLTLVPGDFGLRLMTVGAAGLPSILFQLLYIVPALEHRLRKAGFPPGTGEKVRAQRTSQAQVDSNRRRRERVAARRAARLARRSA